MCRVGAEAGRSVGECEAVLPHPRHTALLPPAGERLLGCLMTFPLDHLVFTPRDVDLSRSPLVGKLDEETYVLGAFNPGLTRLANGNLLLMVRVAEALRHPIHDGHVRSVRWDDGDYHLDPWPLGLG